MGLDNDKELVEIIREKTDRPICVDANQGWDSKEKALEMCYWLAERNCLFVEQPMAKEKIDETAWLRERSPLPIIADEFLQRLPDVRRASQAYDGINIKLMKSTGMHEAYKMAVLAKALGRKLLSFLFLLQGDLFQLLSVVHLIRRRFQSNLSIKVSF